MNAVHALVDFPYPDQWEGTNDQLIAMARIPLDALVRLAPLAGQAGAIGELTGVSHPFWELYGHLIPLVAVERLADDGKPGVAAALLDQRPAEQGTGDEANAARYRRAVASAALGRFEEARAAVDALPASYHAVGYRGLARHLARAGRADEAIEIIGLIDDETVADKATDDLVEATIELAQPESCRRVAALTFERDWLIAAAWLMAAGGEPGMGLDLLNRAPSDDLRLGLGVRLGRILHKAERTDEAAGIVRQLVPAAERLLGPQWFAPETTNAESRLASLGRALRALVAQTGEPLPEAVTPLGLIYETRVGALPPFKLELIVELVTAGRFAEARKLAESSILPSGPGMAMATALMTAGPAVAEEALREAASSLIDAVDAIEPGPLAPPALGAVMRTLTSRGLHSEATRLMEKLVPRPGLWSAVGIWAVDRARAGEMDQVRRLIRQLLVERPMPVADARSRAVVLAAVADRRGSPSDELEAAAALLSDVRVAAGALDVVFAVTDLLARHRGHEAAITFAHSVAGGSAAELAEKALRSEEIKWEGEPSPQNIAAAAVTRAVAAAGMVMANSRNGSGPAESRKWLQRAQALADQAERMAPNLGVAAAVGKYIAAAQAELEDVQIADDAGQVLKTAWLVWERGRPQQAASYALQAASKLSDPFAQTQSAETPQIMNAEDLLRKRDVFNAVGAGLHALVAMVAADRGDRPLVDTAVNAILEASPGLGTLSPSEQVELRACLAIGLQRGGAEEAAADQLQKAAGPAYMLARRGELASFGRLCQAIVELLPSDRAALTWAAWLTAAASAGTSEALRLIAAYLRWIPEHDLANVVVNTQTGQLHSRS